MPIGARQPPSSWPSAARSQTMQSSDASSLTAARSSVASNGSSDARLDREGALRGRRNQFVQRERLGVRRAQIQARKPRHRQHDRVVRSVAQFAQPRVHVAADVFVAQIGPERGQKRPAPQRRGADDGAGGERRKRRVAFAAKRVAWIVADRDGDDLHVVRNLRREILTGMDRVIAPSVAQRLFDFLHEYRGAADLRERPVLDPVSGRGHVEDRAGDAARRELRGDGACLGHGQRAGARNADRTHHCRGGTLGIVDRPHIRQRPRRGGRGVVKKERT